jgi:protein O-mannosyl-transferase
MRRSFCRPPMTIGISKAFKGCRRFPWAPALIILAIVAAYANSLNGPFILDDLTSIPDNPTIRDIRQIGQVLSPPKEGQTVSERPLLNLSFAVNYAIGGVDVRGYHATNVAIHITSALLLFGIARRTMLLPKLRRRWSELSTPIAFAIALLWAVHPLQTHAVTYIVQRAESLMGLFYMLTLYCVIRGARSKTIIWHVAAVMACLLGMATKEVMATAPLIALLYDRVFLSGSFSRALRKRWGLYLGLAASWGLMLYLLIKTGLYGEKDVFHPQFVWYYASSQPGVILYYLRLCFWPSPLCLQYMWPIAITWQEIVPSAIVVGLLLTATLWGLARRSVWGFLGAWFFLILAPSSSFMPLVDLIDEYRMYLSLAAVVTLVTSGGAMAFRGMLRRGWVTRRLAMLTAYGALLAAIATLAFLTRQRNAEYVSEVTLWQAIIDKGPDMAKGVAYSNMGNYLTKEGNYDDAMGCFLNALKSNPDNAELHNNIAFLLMENGNIDKAIEHLDKALENKPDYALAYLNMGNARYRKKEFDAAIDYYQKALQYKRDFAEAYNNLASALGSRGRSDEAIASYRQALEIKPDYSDAMLNLASILFLHGRVKEAMVQWRAALPLQPNNAILLENMAWVLSTCADASLRDGTEAIELARKAVELTGEKSPSMLDTLAAAYAEDGKFTQATEVADKALQLASAQGDATLVAKLRARIQLYGRGIPFREKAAEPDEKPAPPERNE